MLVPNATANTQTFLNAKKSTVNAKSSLKYK